MSRDLGLCNMATNYSGEEARTITKRGRTEATVKSNEQENVKNVAKLTGIGRHQCQRSYSESSRGLSLALLETHTRVDISSGA